MRQQCDRLFVALVITMSLALFGVSDCQANLISFGTGIGLVEGNIDSSITMISGPVALPVNPMVVDQVILAPPTPTWFRIAGTNWVSPFWNSSKTFNSRAASALAGDYVFQFSFMLPIDFTAPQLSMNYYLDNSPIAVRLNGHSISFTGAWENSLGTASTTNAGFFTPGVNHMEFTVRNLAGSGYNPVGLDLLGSVTFGTQQSSVPEPSSLCLFGIGLTGVLASQLRRRQ